MKTRNIYILAGLFAFGAFFTGCDDDDDGKAVAITVKNATNLKEDIFGVVVTEDQPVQLIHSSCPRVPGQALSVTILRVSQPVPSI